jgi:hypothetical protein
MLQNCMHLPKGQPNSCHENEVISKEVGSVRFVEEGEDPMAVTFAEIKVS